MKRQSIIEHVASSHTTATQKGFWDSFDLIIDKMGNQNDVHGDTYFTDDEIKEVKDAFQAQKIMLMVSELGEAIEAARNGRSSNFPEFVDAVSHALGAENYEAQFKDAFEHYLKGTPEEELADVCIRIFDYCGKFGIDLEAFIVYKAEYNKTRERLHGKNY